MSGNARQLLICCLSFLSKEIKENLAFYLNSGILASALSEIFKRDSILPEWFSEDFDYDPLYNSSRWLKKAMAEAFRGLLIERVVNAVGTKVRIAVSEEESLAFLKEMGVTEEDARRFAEKLEKLLLEKKPDTKSFRPKESDCFI